MDVAYIVPGVGLSGAERDRRQQLLNQASGPGIKVTLLEVDDGPAAIECAEDEIAAIAPTLKLARARESDFDAIIIGCFGDVGIESLRQHMGIPIIGPARVTYAMAAAAFPTFGILSLNSGFIEEERELTRKLGIFDRVAHIRALDQPVETIIGAPQQTLKQIREHIGAMQTAAAVPGCMSMAFLLAEQKIRAIGSTRIVNPLHCAIAAAMAMVA